MGKTKETIDLTNSLVKMLNDKGWITAKEVKLRGGDGIVDVVAVKDRQFLRKEIRTYEVKTSRSDFLSDVARMKWKKYLEVTHRVYFAAPAGLLRKSEIPEGAGLIVLGENGWSVVKTARSHEPKELNEDTILSILFSYDKDQKAFRSLRDRLTYEDNISLNGLAKKLGDEISRRLAGCTPEVESDAEYIMRVVHENFGSKFDASKALKFAAAVYSKSDVISSIASLLKKIADGSSKQIVEQSIKKLKLSDKKDKNTQGPDVNDDDMDYLVNNFEIN